MVKPQEPPKAVAPAQPPKTTAAPAKTPETSRLTVPPPPVSQAEAQRQLDAELAKLKALQEREAAKIKAMRDPYAPAASGKGAVSQESRDYLKGINSVLDGGHK